MISLYLFLVGCYLYYIRSKYFPGSILNFKPSVPSWLWIPLFVSAAGMYVFREGWVSGLLLSLCAVSLALMLVQFAAVLGKKYFYGLAILSHGLVLLELL